MQFRKLIFVLAITTTIIFGLLIGSSYAYYVSTSGITLNAKTGSFDGGVAVVFNQSEFVNTVTGVPIESTDVENHADKTKFTLTPDKTKLNGYKALITISLVNIKIDEALKNENFKYKLSCSSNGSSTELKSGTGSDFTGDTLAMGTLSTNGVTSKEGGTNMTLSTDNPTNCTLYVWLQDSSSDQNSLMNKGFSGTIRVNSVFKK